ncbi:hypothetical protein OSB04_023978 [Centaurea solstitialis]|uniref:Mitochondrial protein n=1 Tax=Centaurea solstitialis TaxID=347529 RepID=A0AA38SX00_9ASTR|nr:hypothetical protein OSB04_023978 [Centaurea solstitialis]
MKTPMALPLSLDKDSKGKPVDVTLYRGMIGSLLYLTASRPDIIYLKGTPNLGLWYSKDSGFDLTAYSDSDFAGCKIDRKSTTGRCHLLGGKLVSWTSKKQNSVSTSTTEAEYVADGICCAQVLWLRSFPNRNTRAEISAQIFRIGNCTFSESENSPFPNRKTLFSELENEPLIWGLASEKSLFRIELFSEPNFSESENCIFRIGKGCFPHSSF